MIANETLCKIFQSSLYLTFLLWQFTDTLAAIAFFIFVDTIPIYMSKYLFSIC